MENRSKEIPKSTKSAKGKEKGKHKPLKKKPSIRDMEAEIGRLTYKNAVLRKQIEPMQREMNNNGRRMNELGNQLEAAYKALTPVPSDKKNIGKNEDK